MQTSEAHRRSTVGAKRPSATALKKTTKKQQRFFNCPKKKKNLSSEKRPCWVQNCSFTSLEHLHTMNSPLYKKKKQTKLLQLQKTAHLARCLQPPAKKKGRRTDSRTSHRIKAREKVFLESTFWLPPADDILFLMQAPKSPEVRDGGKVSGSVCRVGRWEQR